MTPPCVMRTTCMLGRPPHACMQHMHGAHIGPPTFARGRSCCRCCSRRGLWRPSLSLLPPSPPPALAHLRGIRVAVVAASSGSIQAPVDLRRELTCEGDALAPLRWGCCDSAAGRSPRAAPTRRPTSLLQQGRIVPAPHLTRQPRVGFRGGGGQTLGIEPGMCERRRLPLLYRQLPKPP